MTPEVFDAAIANTRMRGPTIEAARGVLVYGMTLRQVAKRHDRTHEWARQAVARVKRAARDVLLCPDTWEVVTVCLPPEEAERVRATERRLRGDLV